jgi:hypothetical protein
MSYFIKRLNAEREWKKAHDEFEDKLRGNLGTEAGYNGWFNPKKVVFRILLADEV